MESNRIKVVCIAGPGRSGSTVLSRILANADGFMGFGEGVGVWTSGIVHNEYCSCGARFRDCPRWQAVFQAAFGGFDALHRRGLVERGHPLVRKYDLLALHAPWRTPAQRRRLESISDSLGRLYRAMGEVTGSRAVVDSSKPPGYALMLSTVPDIDLYVIHLVRDSRAVAFSWIRQKVKYSQGDQVVYMKSRSPLRAARDWMRTNALLELYGRGPLRSLRLRYEDFVQNPRPTLARIGAFLGEDFARLPFVDERAVELHDEHFILGNPMQSDRGRIELRPDRE
jgi:hypothetical protein